MRRALTVAAAQPVITAGDVRGNAERHAEAIRRAEARVVVFPELSLTGYELAADAVALDDPALAVISAACAETGTVALVGAPIVDDRGRAAIAILRVDGAGTSVAYRKTWLGEAEAGRFAPGDGPTAIEIDGWRLGLGVCKDTGAAQHTVGTAALGVDAYLAGLVHRADELAEQEARGVVIARTCRAYVVFASFAGPTGDGYETTAGHSTVWSADGRAIGRAGADPGGIARATLD